MTNPMRADAGTESVFTYSTGVQMLKSKNAGEIQEEWGVIYGEYGSSEKKKHLVKIFR